jgi:hypothetical protein
MMKKFFLFSVMYLATAMTILVLFRDEPGYQMADAYLRTIATLEAFVNYLPYVVVVLAVIFFATRQFGGAQRARDVAWAFAACLIFSSAFTFVKTSMPYILPFYADEAFAVWDKVMHGGVDPWIWKHQFADYIPADSVSTLYFIIWGFPAAFFPFVLAVSDSDAERKRRFLILFAFVWIGLGNVVALLGSSVGPVYYDRLLATDRFPDLILALQTSGIADTRIGMVQDGLWRIFQEHSQVAGSGISAFPSVHVAVATLTMLYMCERSKWLAPLAIAFLVSIQFSSVYIGWHYAIDGYFSFIAVIGVWYALRTMSQAKRRNVALPTGLPA